MKWVHITAIIAFVFALLTSGGDYVQGVQTGASWGFLISAIIGIPISLIILLGIFAGGVVGTVIGGILGSLIGSISGGLTVFLLFISSFFTVFSAIFGYHLLESWAVSNFENGPAFIGACIFLILSFLFSSKKVIHVKVKVE